MLKHIYQGTLVALVLVLDFNVNLILKKLKLPNLKFELSDIDLTITDILIV